MTKKDVEKMIDHLNDIENDIRDGRETSIDAKTLEDLFSACESLVSTANQFRMQGMTMQADSKNKASEKVWSLDGEHYFDSLHETFAYEQVRVGDTLYVGDKVIINGAMIISSFDIENLVEGMGQNLDEIVGDAAEDWNLNKEKRLKLESLIANFIDENAPIECWGVENIVQCTVSRDDLDVADVEAENERS